MSLLVPAFLTSSAVVASLAAFSLVPTSQLWGPVLSRGPAGDRCYALTFDDGPLPGATDRILDTLAELGAPAAFFVVGLYASRHPRLLRRIHDEGHLVGAHSFHHSHYSMLRGPWYWQREFDETADAIAQIIGQRPATFRPPMGVKTPYLHRAASKSDQVVITWSRRAFDGVHTSTERILSRLADTGPGEILLLHDGQDPSARTPRDPTPTVQAVRPLIERLGSRGLAPKRLDHLLSIPGYLRPGDGYSPSPS